MSATTTREVEMLEELRAALAFKCRFTIEHVIFGGPQEEAVRVEAHDGKRWKRVGGLLFAPDGQTVADTLSMLMTMRDEVTP